LERNEKRAQSYIQACCEAMMELRGLLIATKFVDDKPKTSIHFFPNDYYPTERPTQKTEFTDRDEIMIRFEHIFNQINSIRSRS